MNLTCQRTARAAGYRAAGRRASHQPRRSPARRAPLRRGPSPSRPAAKPREPTQAPAAPCRAPNDSPYRIRGKIKASLPRIRHAGLRRLLTPINGVREPDRHRPRTQQLHSHPTSCKDRWRECESQSHLRPQSLILPERRSGRLRLSGVPHRVGNRPTALVP